MGGAVGWSRAGWWGGVGQGRLVDGVGQAGGQAGGAGQAGGVGQGRLVGWGEKG